MNLSREYMHHRSGYRFGTRCSWVRVYKGEPGDAPIVLCGSPSVIGAADEDPKAAGYLAAEVVGRFFAGGLPDLPRPLLWIEHRPGPRRRGPGRYFLLSFAAYRPKPEGLGFAKRVTLGEPEREPLTPEEVTALTGSGSARDDRHGERFGEDGPA